MNIYDALNEYKQYLLIEKKVSDNTLKNYMRDLEHFINYIQKQNQVVLINQIDKDMIRIGNCFIFPHCSCCIRFKHFHIQIFCYTLYNTGFTTGCPT